MVSEGILAALTLQYKISDSEKVEFTRAFYETLVEGQSIDVAMTHGRKATNAEVNSTLDFGTLSLYTCSPDGLLFDMKPEQKRRLFPPMHLGCAMRIAMFTLLIAGIILTAVSYLFDLNKLLGFLTFFMGLFGLIGPFIPIFVRMPDPPTISDTLNTYRQGLNRLKRFFWPSPPYSRRQFLKGLVLGLIPALVLGGELILNISTRKTSPSAPQFIPTPTPETEYPVNTYSGHNGAVNAVAWSPDGQMIASAGADESVQVWKWDSQIADNKPYTGHNGAVNAVTWSPDGKLIASASDDRTVQIWEASSKNPFFTYQGHSQKVTAVAWAPTGKYIASASADGTVQVFDPTTKKRIYTFSGHHGTVNAVAWSPESKYIVSGGNDRTAQVWEATTGNLIAAHMHEDKVNAVAWSSVSNETPIISASNDVIRPVHLWSPTVRTPIPIYLNYRGRGVNSVTWSPTGKWIALTDEGFSVQVWDAINNNFSYSSQEDFGTPPLHYVSWAPKGKHIAAAEESYDVDIWIAKE